MIGRYLAKVREGRQAGLEDAALHTLIDSLLLLLLTGGVREWVPRGRWIIGV